MARVDSYEVNVGDKKQTLIIPKTGDKSYDDYLVESEIEKTVKQLEKKPTKEKSKLSRSEISERLREYKDYNQRKKEGKRKYY